MKNVTLTDPETGATASICVSRGFNCFSFHARLDKEDVSVLAAGDGFPEDGSAPSHSGIPILFPYPNRIRGGHYSWNGKDYVLPADKVAFDGAGNAIHGFCLDVPWRIQDVADNSVTGIYQISVDTPDRRKLWPADAILKVQYTLQRNCLRADIEVSNPDDQPLPWGFGTHAYFRLPLAASGSKDNCTVYAPVQKRWQLENCLPTGELMPPLAGEELDREPVFAGLKLDDVYTAVQPVNGVVTCRIRDRDAGVTVEQRCDDSFREIVAFTPPWTDAVCLEPYTCTTDAINLQQKGIDAGWRTLPPGESWSGWIEIDVARFEG